MVLVFRLLLVLWCVVSVRVKDLVVMVKGKELENALCQ